MFKPLEFKNVYYILNFFFRFTIAFTLSRLLLIRSISDAVKLNSSLWVYIIDFLTVRYLLSSWVLLWIIAHVYDFCVIMSRKHDFRLSLYVACSVEGKLSHPYGSTNRAICPASASLRVLHWSCCCCYCYKRRIYGVVIHLQKRSCWLLGGVISAALCTAALVIKYLFAGI